MEASELKEQIEGVRQRLTRLEAEQHRVDIQLVSIKADLSYIRLGQDSLNGNLSKFLWIIGGCVLAAATSWIIRGGLI